MQSPCVLRIVVSGLSSRISSMAPSRLSWATSLSSSICMFRIASFSLTLLILMKVKSVTESSPFGGCNQSIIHEITMRPLDNCDSGPLMIHFQSQSVLVLIPSLSLSHYRALALNQLTGTIPPQLGGLPQLFELYSQNRLVSFEILIRCLFSFRTRIVTP